VLLAALACCQNVSQKDGNFAWFACSQFEVNSNCSFFDIVLNGLRHRHSMQVEALESGSTLDEYVLAMLKKAYTCNCHRDIDWCIPQQRCCFFHFALRWNESVIRRKRFGKHEWCQKILFLCQRWMRWRVGSKDWHLDFFYGWYSRAMNSQVPVH